MGALIRSVGSGLLFHRIHQPEYICAVAVTYKIALLALFVGEPSPLRQLMAQCVPMNPQNWIVNRGCVKQTQPMFLDYYDGNEMRVSNFINK